MCLIVSRAIGLRTPRAATAETARASAFGEGGALIRFCGDPPPFCGVPGTLLGLLGAGGVELTVPGRWALGTGGVMSFRSGERTPGPLLAGGTTSRGAGRSTDTGLWPRLAVRPVGVLALIGSRALPKVSTPVFDRIKTLWFG